MRRWSVKVHPSRMASTWRARCMSSCRGSHRGRRADQELIDNAKRALELCRAADASAARPSPGRTANEGITPKVSPAYSLRNPAKLGAISQHNKNMQAKRDSK